MTGATKTAGVTFEVKKSEYYPENMFRPGTQMWPMDMSFVFMNGGGGDLLCWMTPICWLADQATWIIGTLIVPIYFKEIAEYFLKPYKKWKVITYKELKDIPKADEQPFRGPVVLQQESLNATGAHLLTCGWVYFANKEGPPPGWENYRQFKKEDLEAIQPYEWQSKKYAVVTVGVTTDSRKVPGKYWNYVIEHIVSKGITPVFLGKTTVETGNAANIGTSWDKDLRFDLGVDMRDKTTLIEAVAIIHHAEFIVGHDNGLLHLAGMTETPIIFGYNIASPEHRRPIRPKGKIYDVTLTRKELACIHCQSTFNFVIGFNFRSCMYGDNLCITRLFEDHGKRWKDMIDLVIEETSTPGEVDVIKLT